MNGAHRVPFFLARASTFALRCVLGTSSAWKHQFSHRQSKSDTAEVWKLIRGEDVAILFDCVGVVVVRSWNRHPCSEL